MSWNLPDGCTDADVDRAAGGYDQDPGEDPENLQPPPRIHTVQLSWNRFCADYPVIIANLCRLAFDIPAVELADQEPEVNLDDGCSPDCPF